MTKENLKTYTSYFKYVMIHKKNVLIACWKRGLYVHGIFHDASKFSPKEFKHYAMNFYGAPHTISEEEREQAFKQAWNHHLHNNPHHWQHWVLNGVPLPIPFKHVVEMLCDWEAMGKVFNDTTRGFYYSEKDKMNLHEDTQLLIEETINELF